MTTNNSEDHEILTRDELLQYRELFTSAPVGICLLNLVPTAHSLFFVPLATAHRPGNTGSSCG